MEQDKSLSAYRRLAEFSHQIRRFWQVSEQAARANAIEPQQYQLLLAIKGLRKGARPTVTTLSQCLCIKHHSTVELVNRLVDRGAAVRRPSLEDRREVLIEVTPVGEEILDKLNSLHSWQLDTACDELSNILQRLTKEVSPTDPETQKQLAAQGGQP